jgi:uncharacterized membrane protein
MSIKSKDDAQRRADQIECFKAELKTIEEDGTISLDENQHSAIATYHQNIIKELTTIFDIDSNKKEKQLSLGMKIASFLGALGLGASIFFLFYQFWGKFSTNIQLFILIATPIACLYATIYAASKDRSGYFSKIFGLIALATFILNISMLGQIFNMAPSENALLIWAIFAFLLAYAIDARLLLGAGIILIASFMSAKTCTWSGSYWISFGDRPENFFPAAIMLFLVPLLPHYRFSGFDTIYRVFAMLLFFIPVLILSNWGDVSYMNLHNDLIEGIYQMVGFVFSGLAIFVGIKRGWQDVVNTGNVFFVIFLYTKIFDWWWDWMPKYLFFLVVGLVAILMLFIFKRLRNYSVNTKQEVSI